jgi:Ser/Thr protein kinase RdoA (MazF antagonist)
MINQGIIEKLNKLYHIEVLSYQSIDEGISDSYKLLCDSESYLLKIVGNSFKENIHSSLKVQEYLNRNNFALPELITNNDGELSSRIDSENSYIVYKFIDNKKLNQGFDYCKLGSLLGKLHVKMLDYDGGLENRDKYYYFEKYINYMNDMKYPANKIEEFRVIGEKLWMNVIGLPKGFSHGDAHIGNVLVNKEEQYIMVDFDTVNWSFSCYDIAVMCNATDYFNYESEQLKQTLDNYINFLKGYCQHIDLSEKEIDSIYDFIGLYHFQLQATIIETYGIDCIDHKFLNKQLSWIKEYLNDVDKVKS